MIRQYLDRAITGFDRDPPRNEYQRGYLDALRIIRAEGLDDSATVAPAPVTGAGAGDVAPLRSGSERTQPHYGAPADEFPFHPLSIHSKPAGTP
jgi:hypothetical protein